MHITDVLQAAQLLKDTVLEHENGLVFTFPLNLQRHFLTKLLVKRLVNIRVRALAKLLAHLETVRDGQVLFVLDE